MSSERDSVAGNPKPAYTCLMTEPLQFRVGGSRGSEYIVSAHGAGAAFEIACSCPGGRFGRLCKHAAALLVGDVTNLTSGEEGLDALQASSKGSPLIEKALVQKPKAINDFPELTSLDSVCEKWAQQFEDLGWEADVLKDEGNPPEQLPYEQLNLFGFFKNGKRRKTPSFSLTYCPLTVVSYFDPDLDRMVYETPSPNKRPWSTSGKHWGELGKALPSFLAAAGIEVVQV